MIDTIEFAEVDNFIERSFNLAQTAQANTTHGCGFAHNRNKNAPTNFYTQVNASSRFTDNQFPINDAIYFTDGGSEENDSLPAQFHREGRIYWKRLQDHLTSPTLFGNNGIGPSDVEQGYIGNCWFMASISALAEYPGRVESLFLNRDVSSRGVYGVQLWALNVPITIMVDDWVPLREQGRDYTTWFARIGDDGALWPAIMEKAFAKFHGNWSRIISGNPAIGISALNGSPSI